MMLSAILTLVTGYILFKLGRMERKADERYKEAVMREVLLCTHRTDESILLLEVVTAVQKGKINGELKDAKDQFIKTNRDYEAFVRAQASAKLAEK